MKPLYRRIIDISYHHQLTHIGSCLSAVDLIDAVYQVKRPQDKFILSCGHAALGLYCVLEKYFKADAEALLEKHGVHPNRDELIDYSTGSLGHGIGAAVGMALANPDIKVYCIVSDGEMMEGSVWEALRVASDYNVKNLKVVGNFNGWGAYRAIDKDVLIPRIGAFGWGVLPLGGHGIHTLPEKLRIWHDDTPIFIACKTTVDLYPFLKGQNAHYVKMTEADYAQVI